MIASLPMYWRAENAHHWRAFWACIQQSAPVLTLPDLTPPQDIAEPWIDHWLDPDLVLSMTCGLPFRSTLRGCVTYVGTLGFELPGTPDGYYCSALLRRKGDRGMGKRLAYNAPDSQSGWAVADPFGPYDEYLCTGSHAASARAVADGQADLAFVDAVTWRILCATDAALTDALTVTQSTPPTPGLPLITAKGRDPAALRAALHQAVHDFQARSNPHEMGGPLSFHVLDEARYLEMPIPAPPPKKLPA